MKKVLFFAIITVCMLTISCGETEHEFSNYHCYFVFDNGIHNNAVAAGAMTPYSNIFVVVKKKEQMVGNSTLTHFLFTEAGGGKTQASKANGVDMKRTIRIGQNNGIIIGYGNMSDPPVFYAYDLECPNCFSPDTWPQRDYYLSVSATGIATCAVCKRQYSLKQAGIIVAGNDGKKLIRYRASTSGPYGILHVN